MRKDILDRLKKEKAGEGYKEFNKKIIPGIDTGKVIGVRVPVLRSIAGELAKSDFRTYINELPGDCMYEERMLHGMILGYAKIDWDEWCGMVRDFVPYIRDWATCDSCAMGMKLIRKHPDEGWKFLQEFLRSEGEYSCRFGIVMLLAHYVNAGNEKYIGQILREMEKADTRRYYVMMAVAWAVSACYIRFPEATEKLLAAGKLDAVTQNNAVQKIRDSYRVSQEDKDRMLRYKAAARG